MKYLQDYKTDEQAILYKSTGAFFAIGQQQFEEKKRKGVKYVSLGFGLICPKSEVDNLLEGLDSIQKKAITQDFMENGAKKIIERAYFNYETQITMDNSDALAALKPYVERFPLYFKEEKITQVFNNCFDKAVKNDWF